MSALRLYSPGGDPLCIISTPNEVDQKRAGLLAGMLPASTVEVASRGEAILAMLRPHAAIPQASEKDRVNGVQRKLLLWDA